MARDERSGRGGRFALLLSFIDGVLVECHFYNIPLIDYDRVCCKDYIEQNEVDSYPYGKLFARMVQ